MSIVASLIATQPIHQLLSDKHMHNFSQFIRNSQTVCLTSQFSALIAASVSFYSSINSDNIGPSSSSLVILGSSYISRISKWQH